MRIDINREFSVIKNKMGKGGKKLKALKPRISLPFFKKKSGSSSKSKGDRRTIVIPSPVHTVIAVVICCIVMVAAGFAVFTVEQKEINDLKSDLKYYTSDGVVSSDIMDNSVSLNMEAMKARVAALERMANKSTVKQLSKEDIQWLSSELASAHRGAQILEDILNDIDADKVTRKAFEEQVQTPLAEVQEAYDKLGIEEKSSAGGNGDAVGAATNNGLFKTKEGKGHTFRLILIAAIVLVLLVCGFLFRERLFALILRRSEGKKATKKGGKAKSKSGNPSAKKQTAGSKNSPSSAPRKKMTPAKGIAPEDIPVVASAEKEIAPEINADETAETPEPAPGETDDNTATTVETEHDEFYGVLAPGLQKLAEEERRKAEEGAAMPAPAEEDLISFDDLVTSQKDIGDDDEDDGGLFTK